MINRISNSIRNIGSRLSKNGGGNKSIYSQNDQEMIDTLKAYIATETYRSCYYKYDGDFNKFLNDNGSEAILEQQQQQHNKYSEQKNRINEILNLQIKEMFELIESNGGQNSYPPPLKDLPYYSMEEKLKRCLEIKETDNRGKPIQHPRGFKLHVRKSNIDHKEAGYGVHVEGEIVPGTIVAIYPGDTYDGNNIPTKIIDNNDYMMSRYDGTIIDGRSWNKRADELILKEKFFNKVGTKSSPTELLCFKNPFAIGNFINHPPLPDSNNNNNNNNNDNDNTQCDEKKKPNVIAYSYNFRTGFLSPKLEHYIPNKTVTEHSIFKDSSVLVRSLVLIAYTPIKDQELFLNYRFNPDLSYPDWYHQPDLEEAKRRWGERRSLSIHSILNRN